MGEDLKIIIVDGSNLRLACIREGEKDLGYYPTYAMSDVNKLFLDRLNMPNCLNVSIYRYNEVEEDKSSLDHFLSIVPDELLDRIERYVKKLKITCVVLSASGSKDMMYDMEFHSVITFDLETKKYTFELISSFNYVITCKKDYIPYYNWYNMLAKKYNYKLKLTFKRPVYDYGKIEIMNVDRKKVIVSKEFTMLSVQKQLGKNFTDKAFIGTPWYYKYWNEAKRGMWLHLISEETKKLMEYTEARISKYNKKTIPMPDEKYKKLTEFGFVLFKITKAEDSYIIQRYTHNKMADRNPINSSKKDHSWYFKKGYEIIDGTYARKHILKLIYSPNFYEDFFFQLSKFFSKKEISENHYDYNYYYCRYISRTKDSLTRSEQFALYQFANLVKIMCKILDMDYYAFLTNDSIEIC